MSDPVPLLSRAALDQLYGALVRESGAPDGALKRRLIAQARAYLDLRDRLEALADEVQGCVLCDGAPPNPNCHECTAAGAEADFAAKIRALLREPLEPGADHD